IVCSMLMSNVFGIMISSSLSDDQHLIPGQFFQKFLCFASYFTTTGATKVQQRTKDTVLILKKSFCELSQILCYEVTFVKR
ncbi:MAG: hypothetical protein J6N19_06935, partial [Clostridium sp.]|nr:hypothetical protein [Clostridium sp.]